MKKTPQQLKTEIPLLLDGIDGPSRDITKDCYCIPFWWHGGCTNTFYDPAFAEIATMYEAELDFMARKLLGFSSVTSVSKTHDEPELKVWAMTFRGLLPSIATLEAHIMAKGYILSYADARHISPDEVNRLLVLADTLLMCKIMGITWQEALDNDYLSVHAVVSEGILTTEFVQFVHTVREFMNAPDSESFDEKRLMEVYEAAERVFKKIERESSVTVVPGREAAETFMKSMVKDTLDKIRAAVGEDAWKDLQQNVGKTFDDLLDEDETT